MHMREHLPANARGRGDGGRWRGAARDRDARDGWRVAWDARGMFST